MELSILDQQLEALISLAVGFGTGILYDFLGVLRRRLRLAVFTYIFDLFFCLAVGCVFFLVGYGPGGGRLRLFMLIFIVIGCVLYFLLLSKILGKFLGMTADFLEFLIKCLFMPFVLLHRLIKKIREKIKNSFNY